MKDNGGAYFVPAFSGLFAPHWRPDARGALVGLIRYVNKGHIARAAEETTAFQTREVLEAMNRDSASAAVGGGLTELFLVSSQARPSASIWVNSAVSAGVAKAL